ncbi:tyrosine-type recombinase/integrase [Aureimonas psammosilenae]|uniref:tyrosine-type recombinase/integrase n=1 Tax=Aureimonas psammosilenae TaxID=2495496 RepID=UPI001260AB3D|nr:site-specific integrase [Aureimonas psammosilenae]
MRFTVPAIAKLTLPEGKSDHIIFDDAMPGFGIRLRAGGKKVWIAQYRVGTKQRRLTIGSTDKLSLDAARAEARAILAKAQLGTDPQNEKVEARNKASVTLGSIADTYSNGPAKRSLRPNSYASLLVHLNKHWKPLRDRPLHGIQRADIASRLNEIAEENGPFAANRARVVLSSLFAWAMSEGLAEGNPVIGTRKATEEVSRDRVLSDAELSLVWKHAGAGDYGRIVRLLILTGQRREEVGGMAHSELDLAKALWTIPKERAKNGLAHDVPLSASALAIIDEPAAPKIADTRKRQTLKTFETPEAEERDFLFGAGEGSFSGWSKSKAALDARVSADIAETAKAAGAKPKPMPPWRLHDIRRTVATRLGDIGVLPHVVEAVLNHISGHRAGVAGIYNRATYASEKRAALDMWGLRVRDVVEGIHA